MRCPHDSDPLRWCKECAVSEKLRLSERIMRWPNTLGNVVCGFDCPPGWLPAVERLTDLLERIGGVRCVQVKEKFGGLRYYVEAADGGPIPGANRYDVYGLIHACEEACAATCLYCGKRGTLRQGGWWRTLCDSCDYEYVNDRGPKGRTK